MSRHSKCPFVRAAPAPYFDQCDKRGKLLPYQIEDTDRHFPIEEMDLSELSGRDALTFIKEKQKNRSRLKP